jgi:hypothetical protein
MPKNILSESAESLSNITSRKRFVSALDQRCISFRCRCSRHIEPRDTFYRAESKWTMRKEGQGLKNALEARHSISGCENLPYPVHVTAPFQRLFPGTPTYRSLSFTALRIAYTAETSPIS